MTVGDDLRLLAAGDPHARGLVDTDDGYLQRKGVTVISVRERGKPVAAMALMHNECPIDPAATWQIVYWTVERTLTPKQLRAALVKSMHQAVVMGIADGSEKGWGIVLEGDTHVHLSGFLDEVVEAKACERIDTETGLPPTIYYIADLVKARQFMERQ